MSALGSIGVEKHCKEHLPLRDWILLPASALLTILVIAISTELAARWLFPLSQTGLETCFVTDDPSGTAPAKPNSVCSERLPESSFTAEYRFNNRGDRDDVDLKAKQPGTFRIVMIGSSFAMGLFTPREMTFAALLPKELSRRTGRKIEVYNKAKGGKFRGGPYPIRGSATTFDEVLSARPDMILWVITPMDIGNSELGPSVSDPATNEATRTDTSRKARDLWKKVWDAIAQGTYWGKLHYHWEQSRSSLALEHYLILSESPSQYIESYLRNDSNADFLKTEPSPHWQSSLNSFDVQAAAFERQASDAGIPLVAVLLPNRAQAAMITANFWPQGYDPYRLATELRGRIETNGGAFIDILLKFRNIPDPEQYYFPVDGHLNTRGHAVIARMLSDELTDAMVPALGADSYLHQVQPEGK